MAEITAEELIHRRNTIKRDLTELQQKEAVAKADEARLRVDLTQALEDLENTFGCSTYDEAVAKRDSLLEELNSLYTDLEGRINALRSQ